jgi:hypothetical protein
VFGVIDPFYEAAESAVEPGHLWCDQPIYLPPTHGLKIERVNPTDDRDLDLTVCGRTADSFATLQCTASDWRPARQQSSPRRNETGPW